MGNAGFWKSAALFGLIFTLGGNKGGSLEPDWFGVSYFPSSPPVYDNRKTTEQRRHFGKGHDSCHRRVRGTMSKKYEPEAWPIERFLCSRPEGGMVTRASKATSVLLWWQAQRNPVVGWKWSLENWHPVVSVLAMRLTSVGILHSRMSLQFCDFDVFLSIRSPNRNSLCCEATEYQDVPGWLWDHHNC